MSIPLYDVPRYSRIKIVYESDTEHTIERTDEEFEFDHIDGMYSYCTDDEGNVIHLAAWTPVEIIREGPAHGTG